MTIEDGDADYGAAWDKFLRILKIDTSDNKIRGLSSVSPLS